MAETTITNLPSASVPLSGSELVELVQAGESFKVNAQKIANILKLASTVEYNEVAGSTYSNAQEALNQLESSGLIEGGIITKVDSTHVSVTSGQGMIRTTDNQHGEIVFINFPANASIAIPVDGSKEIVVNYNSGSPQIEGVNVDTVNPNTYFLLGEVGNGDGELYISNLRQTVNDFKLRVLARLYSTESIVRSGDTGLILADSADTNRYVEMSSGEIWAILDLQSINGIDTGISDTFTTIYQDTPSGFVETAGVTQWPNDNYDDGSGTLQPLSSKRYGVRWFYLTTDNSLFMVYGTGDWKSLGEASAEPVPTDIPHILGEYGILIGRMIILKGSTIAAEVSSTFTHQYSFETVTNHGSLGNLIFPYDDHTQYAHVDGRRAFTNPVSGADPTKDEHLATQGWVYDQVETKVYSSPLTGVVDVLFPMVGTRRTVAAGETTDVATDFPVSNQHAYILVNSITTGGDIVITGTTLNEGTAVPSAGQTETLTVDTSTGQYYQTHKKWWEITNIDVTGGTITGIDFDYGIVGYPDMGNRNFKLLGYRCDAYSSSDNADFAIIIEKIQDDGNGKMSVIPIEDMGVDSGSAGDQLIDGIRTGADDRTYNPAVGSIWLNNTNLVFKQLDFETYFSGDEYIFESATKDEGYIIRIIGSPTGGFTGVDFISLELFYKITG